MMPGVIRSFTHFTAEAIQAHLGGQLVAIYLHGSAATGDFVPNRSDLDLIAVVEEPLPASKKEELQTWFATNTPPSELAGIDCEVLTRQEAASPSQFPHWDTIIRVQRHQQHFDARILSRTDGYSLLELAVARERGCILIGPSPMTVIAASPRIFLLQACIIQLKRLLSWDVINDCSSAVLTACRSWLYLSQGLHGTKSEAGTWARSQSPRYDSLISTALTQRQGETWQVLEDEDVKAFCRAVLFSLEEAIHASDMESNK